MDKRTLYQLIISQLHEDGFTDIASQLSNVTLIPRPPQVAPQRLYRLASQGRTREAGPGREKDKMAWDKEDDDDSGSVLLGATVRPKGLDFDREKPDRAPDRHGCRFTTRYLTTHKGSVRCGRFSPDGKLVATGSMDTSVKLADVEKMKAHGDKKDHDHMDDGASRNVTRSFYDHSSTVTDVCFHPTTPLLASCSKDMSIKFFDYSKTHAKRSVKFIQDAVRLRSIDFHPSGDFLLASGKDARIRLYDTRTQQAFVCPNAGDNHSSTVNMVRYRNDGGVYASAGKDGNIKLWDTTSATCISTFPAAHSGNAVTSVQFSRNGRYLLSCGKDSTVKLWDLSTTRPLRIYSGSVLSKRRLPATFSFSEDFVLAPDESGAVAVAWDTRSGDLLHRLTGHNQLVRFIASSPVENALLTCSDDSRARFWVV